MSEWKLVPVEPTQEMILAAFDAVTNASGEGMIRARWRVMLDAAPAAPQEQYRKSDIGQAEPVKPDPWPVAPNRLMPNIDLQWAWSCADQGTEAGVIIGALVNESRLLRERVSPQEQISNDRVSLAYKNGYEEALNDCIRNGGEAWARSMFANGGEHIKPRQAGPVLYRKYLHGRDAFIYRDAERGDEQGTWEPLYLHPPTAEVQRLRAALEHLIELCRESDDAQYSTLGTKTVRAIALDALEV